MEVPVEEQEWWSTVTRAFVSCARSWARRFRPRRLKEQANGAVAFLVASGFFGGVVLLAPLPVQTISSGFQGSHVK